LGTLQILLQSGCSAADSVLAESFLGDEELYKSFDVRSLPFEVAVCMISRADVGVEEELAGIGIGPVFWDLELGLSCLDSLDEFLKSAVFTDKF